MTDGHRPGASDLSRIHERDGIASRIPISTEAALVTWFSSWLIANFITVPVVLLVSGGEVGNLPPAVSLSALAVQWATFIAALVFASKQFGTGSLVTDLGAKLRTIDLIGVPVGVVMQALVLPLLYWPLREVWPDTFSQDALEERSRSLIGGAGGVALLLLSVAVIVGAPVVEELVYRGLLQRSISRRLGGVGAWVATSALFAAVHFSFVDSLGLFVAGLVFGLGVLVTGRIGFGVFAHLGFNGFAMLVMLATR